MPSPQHITESQRHRKEGIGRHSSGYEQGDYKKSQAMSRQCCCLSYDNYNGCYPGLVAEVYLVSCTDESSRPSRQFS